MPIIASFAVPHPPLIVKEVGQGAENQVIKTIESYQKVAEEIAKIRGMDFAELVDITTQNAERIFKIWKKKD